MRALSTRSLALRHRLAIFAVGATFAVAGIGAAAFWSSQRIAADMGAMQEHRLRPLVALDDVGRALERQRALVLATLASTNDVMQQELDERVKRDREHIPAVLQALSRGERDAAAKRLLSDVSSAIARTQGEALDAVITRLHKGQFAEADIESQRLYQPQMREVSALLDRLISTQVDLSSRDYQAAVATVRTQALFAIAATLAALAGGLAFAVLAGRALHRILGAGEQLLAQGTMELARGRLGHRIAIEAGGESSIAGRLNAMAEDFGRVVARVGHSAADGAATSQRLAGASHELSERTAEQAASLEQTAASMQQLAAAVARSAELAESGRALADRAASMAREGGGTIADVESTLRAMVESERQVADIAGVIDGIAFQTNILALNAAVEAARAGEHGRGFAVVAAEVRSLSQRSASAAQQIRRLLGESAERIHAGHLRATEAASAMRAIVETSGEASGRIADIAHAVREQAAGIAQVNRAIEHLEQAVQANARLASRTSAEADDMRARAETLVEATAGFDAAAAPAASPGATVSQPLLTLQPA